MNTLFEVPARLRCTVRLERSRGERGVSPGTNPKRRTAAGRRSELSMFAAVMLAPTWVGSPRSGCSRYVTDRQGADGQRQIEGDSLTDVDDDAGTVLRLKAGESTLTRVTTRLQGRKTQRPVSLVITFARGRLFPQSA